MRRILLGAGVGAALASAAAPLALTASAASAPRQNQPIVVTGGSYVRLAGTRVGCGVLKGGKGNVLLCTLGGSRVWALIGSAGIATIAVPAGRPITDVLHGSTLYAATWVSAKNTAQEVTALTAQVATLQTRLAQTQQQLAQAQSGAIGAMESQGVAGIMKTLFPQLTNWFKQNGGNVAVTTDSTTGFADYDFSCDSCAAG